MSVAKRGYGRTLSLLVIVAMLAALLVAVTGSPAGAQDPITVQLLHNNDGESQLLSDEAGFGGAARFVTLVNDLRADALTSGVETILVSSGDNFLAGPEFQAGLNDEVFYDAIVLEALGYDAIALGNHDFDFGPDLLADFINAFGTAPPYLSANLDFTNEPALQALVTSGVIAGSTTVTKGGEDFGIVGAITPDLPAISSPRDVIVGEDVAAAIQPEIDALIAGGVNKIIVISHLQGIDEDLALAPLLSGVDVMVAGGGDELLSNPGDLLIPGDEENIFGPYPIIAQNAEGDDVPVITTPGSYRYVGQITLDFDAAGVLTGFSSGPVRVSSIAPDAVAEDPAIKSAVTDPVTAALAAQATNVIATSEVDLDGRRGPGVRTMETNQGNLAADSMLWQARALAAEFGVKAPDVAFQNGGGIRNDSIIPAGDYTELDTFDALPFGNFVSVVEDIPPAQFLEILENAYSAVEFTDGRFAQIAGLSVVYDPAGIPMEIDGADDVTVLTTGRRVISAFLDDGTAIIEGGNVMPGAPDITIAIADFLARGGDQYPFRDAPFTPVGVSYQQALFNYITAPTGEGGLGGEITATDYPEGGEGRIIALAGAPLGVVDQTSGRWAVPGADAFFFGVSGDSPFLGDWDGDGVKTPGLYRPSTGFAYITNGLMTAFADAEWFMGNPGDIPLVGDWDGDGIDSFGVYRPSTGQVFLRNAQTTGFADIEYYFGNPGDTPFAGDFDGDGRTSVGLYRESTGEVFMRNTQTTGFAEIEFFFGNPGDVFVGGDWDNDRIDTVGIVRPGTGRFFGRNSNDQGFADFDYPFDPSSTPVVSGAVFPPEPDLFLVASEMRGSTEVPGPGDDNALGIAFVSVFGPDSDAIFCLEFANTSADTPTAIHIHEGAAGVGGGIVADFGVSAEDWEQDPAAPSDEFVFGPKCAVVAEDTANDILATPGDFYVNIHSEEFPAGAVREQLRVDTGPPTPLFEAGLMLGRNEVPGPGDLDGAGVVSIIAPVTDNGEWCFESLNILLDPITAAHIHAGATGVDGGVLVDLEIGTRWPVVTLPDGIQVFNGCVAVSPTDQASITGDPGGFYANTHTETFGPGAVRAQFATTGDPVFFTEAFSGDQEVPGPGDPDGSGGVFVIVLDPEEDVALNIAGVRDIATPTAMHIHEGAAGVSGPVVVDFDVATTPFFAGGPDFEEFTGFTDGWQGWVDADGATIDAIIADPEGYYLNVHNAEFAAGAVRGQMFSPGPPPG